MKVFEKEKPPATARERLAALQDALGDLAHQYSVEFVADDAEPSVYLNYDFNTAVVATLEGDGYQLMALHWAPDHGVDDEHYIGVLADVRVAAQVMVQFAKDHESL